SCPLPGTTRDSRSFPTRRSSDLVHDFRGKTFVVAFGGELINDGLLNTLIPDLSLLSALGIKLVLVHGSRPQVNEQLRLKGETTRSEEHTSELQSRENLVCRLLLE